MFEVLSAFLYHGVFHFISFRLGSGIGNGIDGQPENPVCFLKCVEGQEEGRRGVSGQVGCPVKGEGRRCRTEILNHMQSLCRAEQEYRAEFSKCDPRTGGISSTPSMLEA